MVVPFLGSEEDLSRVHSALMQLRLRTGDTVTIVDNRPAGGRRDEPRSAVRVLRAPELGTPGYARNRGAAAGEAQWLVFIDADTVPAPDLLERYFDPEPDARTALIGGGVRDEPVPYRGPLAARYCYLRGAMSQDDTFRFGEYGFPKSANLAVRRSAFAAAGGFRDDIRAAEDADLSYRLRRAGWKVERRENATVVHRSRQSVHSFARQKVQHGAGAAWLERRYPGSFPPRRRPGLIWWGVRSAVRGVASAIRFRNRDLALRGMFEPLELLAYEFGRSLPNERPLNVDVWLTALRRLRAPRGTKRL